MRACTQMSIQGQQAGLPGPAAEQNSQATDRCLLSARDVSVPATHFVCVVGKAHVQFQNFLEVDCQILGARSYTCAFFESVPK